MTSEPPAEQNAQRLLEGSAAIPPSSERLAARLQRLERQIRAFKELHVAEVTEEAQRLHTIAQLHADELQLILDELADIERELAARSEAESRPGSGGAATSPAAPASPGDPAASSRKRAKWLAEEERRARPVPVSRRELLLGRGDDPENPGPVRRS